ncbi:MAG: nickel transporter permease NikC [Methanosaeta sp. PtaU1.Bin060]|nr:MAG: nickel transporter permease NikC [Methanosaeta sp. PtaU1.Bin060]
MFKSARSILDDKLALIGLSTIIILLVIAICAPSVSPYDPMKINLQERLSPPSLEHPMGTDDLGRDYLSRIIYGTRISMTAAALITMISLIIGLIVGTASGYFGGIVDETLMRIVDIMLAFPSLIITIAIAGILGPTFENLIIAMTVTGWVGYSRLIRSSVLLVKEQDFVVSSKAIGCSDLRVVFDHIVPNAIAPIVVLATLDMGNVILGLCGMSFLGLGAQPPTPEWGSMLEAGKPFMESMPTLMIFPGLMIMITVMAFNFLGDGLRDALDPRIKAKVEI